MLRNELSDPCTPPEMSCAEADFIGQFAAYQQQYAARIAELTERFERDRATFDGRLKEAFQATQARTQQRDQALQEVQHTKQELHTASQTIEIQEQVIKGLRGDLATMVAGSEHQKVCTELVDTRTKLDAAAARIIALEAQLLQMEQRNKTLRDQLLATSSERERKLLEQVCVCVCGWLLSAQLLQIDSLIDTLRIEVEAAAVDKAEALAQANAVHEARLKRLSDELEVECRQSQRQGQENVALTARTCELQDALNKIYGRPMMCKVCKHPASLLVHKKQ